MHTSFVIPWLSYNRGGFLPETQCDTINPSLSCESPNASWVNEGAAGEYCDNYVGGEGDSGMTRQCSAHCLLLGIPYGRATSPRLEATCR